MNASEVIAKLAEIIRVHGDLPVVVGSLPLREVEFKSSEDKMTYFRVVISF